MDIDYLKTDNKFIPRVPVEVIEYTVPRSNNRTQFCTYIDTRHDDIVFRTFGYHTTVKRGFEITEVLRAAPTLNKKCVTRNLFYSTLAGYTVVYYQHDVKRRSYGYEIGTFEGTQFDKWYSDLIPGLYGPLINKCDIFKHPKYKYCGLQTQCPYPYLVLYSQYPETEYFGKLGITPSITLIRKAKKDKQFVRYMICHAEELKKYTSSTILYAYKNKMEIKAAANALSVFRTVCRNICQEVPEIKGTKIDRMKLSDYLEEHDTSGYCYNDYLKAVKELGLDLNDTKNVYPKDFQRMHDLRINQNDARKLKLVESQNRALARKFKKAAAELQKFGYAGESYVVIIPKRMRELTIEGEALHHCVGKMGYDKKMADGISFIAFVRKIGNENEPFVTLEYKYGQNKVVQAYADHDSKPPQDVLNFVAEWEAFVKNKLKEKVA